jgi:LmbE family N-acetylglucosaminyl deacetylase
MHHIKKLSQINIKKGTKILIFIAHPDDEASFMSGFMQKALKLGAVIKIVCLTDGAKSTLRAGLDPGDSLEAVRRKELLESLLIIGIRSAIHAEFHDGECGRESGAIAQFMSEQADAFKPDIIVSLEPNGVYGHPDHIEISRLATEIARSRKLPLLYATVDSHFRPDAGSRRLVGKDVAPLEPTVCLTLTPLESIKKIRSIRAHRSQFQLDLKSTGPGLTSLYTMLHKEFIHIVLPAGSSSAQGAVDKK